MVKCGPGCPSDRKSQCCVHIFTEICIQHNILEQASTLGRWIMFNRAATEELDSVFTSLMLSAQTQSNVYGQCFPDVELITRRCRPYYYHHLIVDVYILQTQNPPPKNQTHHMYLYINNCKLTITYLELTITTSKLGCHINI